MTTHTSNPKTPLSVTERFALLQSYDVSTIVETSFASNGMHGDAVLAVLGRHTERLQALFGAQEGHRAIDTFLAEADEWQERLERYATLHTLDAAIGNKPQTTLWPGWAPKDPNCSKRPLLPIELALVRLIARNGDRGPLLATSMSGADSSELATILPGAVHLSASGTSGEIELPGRLHEGARCPGPTAAAPRRARLPRWALPAITERLEVAKDTPDHPFLYKGSATVPHKIRSSLLMGLRAVMRDAGLGGDPTISPLSIRNGAALERYQETGSIEEVADMLGYRDLNLTQRQIGMREGLVKRKR